MAREYSGFFLINNPNSFAARFAVALLNWVVQRFPAEIIMSRTLADISTWRAARR